MPVFERCEFHNVRFGYGDSTLLKPSYIAKHQHLQIIVINEISITSESDLYLLLRQCAKLPLLNRIVLIGDFAQIRPIGAALTLYRTETWQKINFLVKVDDGYE